uniref:Ig-like domain-containing protein n=1 Tax=Electrophorus electricus TaxID=8005 RepID=A0A4W4E2D2_ELEEL
MRTVGNTNPPKNVSVSITPSGEILEGSSVTLTCSSDANPPVQNYNWFKEKILLGKESTHIIPNISFQDSGEYKCKSSNEHGSKYSSVILNVMCKLMFTLYNLKFCVL